MEMGKPVPQPEQNNGKNGSHVEFVEAVSPSMQSVESVIRELAQTDVPVLILAEQGAGKLTTAQRIHALSPRSSQPFRNVSCHGLKPEELRACAEKAEESGYGTLYLGEIAELSLECQSALLELLPVSPVGPTKQLARIICGSARDLELEVKPGHIREDLYYRISGVCLRLPPLRQRRQDIPILTSHFLEKYAAEFHRAIPSLSSETLQLFDEYSWPGNLHELEDAAKALVALGNENIAMGGLRSVLRRPENGNGARLSLKEAARAASREAEKQLILRVLTRTRWNRRRAAQELQISYKALLYKLKQIGFDGYEAR